MPTSDGSAGGTDPEPRTGRDRRCDTRDGRSAGGPAVAASSGSVPDDAALIGDLPAASAVALRLRRAGHPDSTIAVALGIPAQAVPVTVGIAQAKLDALLRDA